MHSTHQIKLHSVHIVFFTDSLLCQKYTGAPEVRMKRTSGGTDITQLPAGTVKAL